MGVPLCIKGSAPEKRDWCSLTEAIELIPMALLKRLLENGEIESSISFGIRGHIYYRIKRKSLQDWKSKNESEFISFIELGRVLGISEHQLSRLIKIGIIRKISTHSYKQPSYIRQDALRLLDSLEKGNPPVTTVWDKTRYQTLSEARRSLLLSPERFSSVLMAIIDGRLSPVGRIPSIAGVLGYIFSNIELQMHSHVCATTSNSDINLKQDQAARFLGIPLNKFRVWWPLECFRLLPTKQLMDFGNLFSLQEDSRSSPIAM
jgi:hypothetical protein